MNRCPEMTGIHPRATLRNASVTPTAVSRTLIRSALVREIIAVAFGRSVGCYELLRGRSCHRTGCLAGAVCRCCWLKYVNTEVDNPKEIAGMIDASRRPASPVALTARAWDPG